MKKIMRIFIILFIFNFSAYSQSPDFKNLIGKEFVVNVKNKRNRIIHTNIYKYIVSDNPNVPYVIKNVNDDNIQVEFKFVNNELIVSNKFSIFDKNIYGDKSKVGEVSIDGEITYPSSIEVGQLLEDNRITVVSEGVIRMSAIADITNRKVIEQRIENTFIGDQKCYVIEANVKIEFKEPVRFNQSSCVRAVYCPAIGFNISEESTNCKGKILSTLEIEENESKSHCNDLTKDFEENRKDVNHFRQQDQYTCWLASLRMILKSNKCIDIPGDIYLNENNSLDNDSGNIRRLAELLELEHIYSEEPIDVETLVEIFNESSSGLWLGTNLDNGLYNESKKGKITGHSIVVAGMTKDCKTGKVTDIEIYDPYYKLIDNASSKANYTIDINSFLEYVNIYDILYRK